MASGIPTRLTPREGRAFGLKVGLAFLVLGVLFLWRGKATAAIVTGTLGGLLVIGGLLAPAAMSPIYRGWMRLALLLSKVTTPVFLGIVYYVVLTPVGLLRRTVGQHPLVHSPSEGSYWIEKDRARAARSSMTRPF